jgi:hypothetical protein
MKLTLGVSFFMAFDDHDFRPITFQGVTFPATLMAIDVLTSVLDINDEDLGEWLWRLAICRGVSKRAPAERCARCARQAADLILEHRQAILDYIRKNLASYGFDPEETYRDWLMALQKIAELSEIAETECVLSAPFRPGDATAADAERILKALDKMRKKAIKFYDKEEPPPPPIP